LRFDADPRPDRRRADGPELGALDRATHIFLRYSDEAGREINLEATSGALPARTAWYHQNLPMTDRAIESGLYMRTLTRREAVAHMASTVVDFLMSEAVTRRRLKSVNSYCGIIRATATRW
jgi:hypothetical protein